MAKPDDEVERLRKRVVVAVEAYYKRKFLLWRVFGTMAIAVALTSTAFMVWQVFWNIPRSQVSDQCINKPDLVHYFSASPQPNIMMFPSDYGNICRWISTEELLQMSQNSSVAREVVAKSVTEYVAKHPEAMRRPDKDSNP